MPRLEEDRIEAKKRAQKKVRELIGEEVIEEILRAAGARRIEEDAKRALRTLTEETIARYAIEAVEVAHERGQESVDAGCISCAAVRAIAV